MKLKEGDQVVVIGTLDQRIRKQQTEGLVKGTLYCRVNIEGFEVAVLLENGDIFLGKEREVRLAKEQE